MMWLKTEDVKEFLSRRNYDIRVSHNARWIDQKCAADVVTIVSDCILQYVGSYPDKSFTSMDVWYDDYTVANVEAIFKKPSPSEEKARSEYDKYFQQPMEMLAYAGVLCKEKKGTRNYYIVAERDILEFLSIRERNALTFLQLYISKVLTDSGLMPLFENFFEQQTKTAYDSVKDGFTNFTINNTPINGAVECRRIFIKVLNPLAFQRGKYGTEKGRISKNRITYDMLMYNRDNFRDIYADKPKELTRSQYAEQIGLRPSVGLNTYMSQKAKDDLVQQISLVQGLVQSGEKIIDRGVEFLKRYFKTEIDVVSTRALKRVSGGDARKLLNAIEMLVTAQIPAVDSGQIPVISDESVSAILGKNLAAYDKKGENHYDIISAFIKSLRGSDPNAAVYYLARMLEGGEDPKFIARRMVILASEDIGNANPNALLLANACFDTVHKIGYPECRITLSHVAVYLACSPKSNAAYMAIENAIAFVRQTGDLPVPLHVRNAPTKLMKDLGYSDGYRLQIRSRL